MGTGNNQITVSTGKNSLIGTAAVGHGSSFGSADFGIGSAVGPIEDQCGGSGKFLLAVELSTCIDGQDTVSKSMCTLKDQCTVDTVVDGNIFSVFHSRTFSSLKDDLRISIGRTAECQSGVFSNSVGSCGECGCALNFKGVGKGTGNVHSQIVVDTAENFTRSTAVGD